MVQISIIIPCYNVEKYLQDCLNSIIFQVLTAIEIICIDDGSSDNTLSILEEFAKIDTRIKILKQKNLGAASARNYGLSVAQGEYIHFLDSDDFILSNYFYEEVYQKIQETQADILIFGYQKYYEQSKKFKNYYIPQKIIKLSHTEMNLEKLKVACLKLGVVPWNKLYKRSFLQQQQLTFLEGIMHEDIIFTWQNIILAQNIAVIDLHLYVYRQRNGSVMSSEVYSKYADLITAFKVLLKFLINSKNLTTYQHIFIPKLFKTFSKNLTKIPNQYKERFFYESQSLLQEVSLDKARLNICKYLKFQAMQRTSYLKYKVFYSYL